ncbi:AAA family ATPase [uncultured Methanobrevibacter sp.]|uniref:AAA family ATPase n=1 Tax=uncultured Methanobrevibacter sp. TaxID=253161 RepID=UPI00260E384C|nr:AAA family ATPase [uncultured Methanobrevibacter sp.]
MEEIMNFQIRNFGPIKEADIDIGKINIIGGHNATGKSSASKLLYCFLKASCNKRQDFAYESLSNSISVILSRIKDDVRLNRRTRDMDFTELLEEFEHSKDEYYSSEKYTYNKFLERDINNIDNSIEEIQENGDSLYLSILRSLLRIEFLNNTINGQISFDEDSFNLSSLFTPPQENISNKIIKPKFYQEIYDVFYVDSFSIFDLNRAPHSFRLRRNGYYSHVDYLNLMLRDSEDQSVEMFDDTWNENIILVEEKINNIINGKIEFNRGFRYVSKDSEPYPMQNTASGIKQIGIIQLLLSNRKLKEDSFIIIDEPEVNLHPEWQFKFAEILLLLVKELNISIYINTHSPMFIEAIEVFSNYYGLKDDTYYYLTKFKDSGYEFKYIDVNNLYELYDELSKPYMSLEKYRRKSKNNDNSN